MFKILSVCKGGGYRYCRTDPIHPRANKNGLYPLHRVLAENKLGRLLNPWEDVHHKDHDKENDDPENLEVLSHSEHAREHALENVPAPVADECSNCGKRLSLSGRDYRARKKRSSDGALYCSVSCAAKRRERAREEPPHGTASRYRSAIYRCRCDLCKSAHAQHERNYRNSKK
jgi:hypothetical protein